MKDESHAFTFSVTFLAIYTIVLLTGIYLLKIDLGSSWIQLGSRAFAVKALLFAIAPFTSMIIGGMVAAKAGLKDKAEGTRRPERFFASFYFGFAIAYFIVLYLGMHLISGKAITSQWFAGSFGLKGLAIGGIIAPALALSGAVKVVSAKARSS
jgi:hypothetical protein